MLYDRKTGEKKNLTEDIDAVGRHFRLGARFSEVYFVTEIEGAVLDLDS